MQNYTTQRGLAQALKTTSETIARTAALLKVGTSGAHPNSPKVFTPADALAIAKTIHADKMGVIRNEMLLTEARVLQNAEHLGRLSGLALAMGSPACAELAELNAVVGKIRKGSGPSCDLKSADGKTRFLNAINPHRANLTAALNAVAGKL